MDPHPVSQTKASDQLGGHKDVLWRLNEIPFRIPQKPEAFAGDLDDTFAKLRFSLNLLVTRAQALFKLMSGVDDSLRALAIQRTIRS